MELKGAGLSDPVRQVQEWVREGDIHDYHHEYEKAIISYDNALQIDPDNADAWFCKAITLNKIKKHSEATRCVAIALSLYMHKN
jgi:tetratricopeptide (TPR) repeat protein